MKQSGLQRSRIERGVTMSAYLYKPNFKTILANKILEGRYLLSCRMKPENNRKMNRGKNYPVLKIPTQPFRRNSWR
jgi:hypothetical protein